MRLSATSTSISSKTIVAASGGSGGGGGGGGASAELTFRYHMFGSEMESFYLYWEVVGNNRVLLWSKSGQQHTSDTDEWDLATVDVTDYVGESGKLILVGIIGADADFKTDAAFCDFNLNGTVSNTTSNNWRTHSLSNAPSTNSSSYAAATSTTLTPGESAFNSWNIRSGSTPSSSTGPDKHYNNSSSSTYIYYEGSGGSTNTSKGFAIRSRFEYTI